MGLIELLVVVLLAGILAFFSISSWYSYQQAIKLETTAQQLLAFLTRLQAEANWYNKEISLWVRRHPWCLGRSELAQQCEIQSTGIFIPPYAGIVLSEFNFKEMTFYGLRNTATPGHIQLTNASGKIRAVLTGQGRLRLCSEHRQHRGIPACQ